VVSRARRPPWPRSWWRLLGVTSRSEAGSLPPPRPGRSRAAAGRLRTPSCTTLTTTAADRQAGSGVSRRRRRSDSANAPGRRQQHERRQGSRPARTRRPAVPVPPNLGAVRRSCPSAGSRGQLLGRTPRRVRGVSCASERYCSAEQRKAGGPAFRRDLLVWWDPGEILTPRSKARFKDEEPGLHTNRRESAHAAADYPHHLPADSYGSACTAGCAAPRRVAPCQQ
jgi:hypothetical protein